MIGKYEHPNSLMVSPLCQFTFPAIKSFDQTEIHLKNNTQEAKQGRGCFDHLTREIINESLMSAIMFSFKINVTK